MNILFHSNQLCERGTETALFDYAIGNENILHNKSFIVIPDGKILCKERYESWQRRFEIFTYKTKEDLHSIIEDNSIDLLYEIEAGDQLNPVYEDIGIPLFVHAVFTTSCRHGDFYVPIHSFLNKKFNTAYPVLPHICRKRETTSDKIEVELSLPNDRIYTYGCIGGGQSFSIKFVQETVIKVAQEHKNIFFIFVNINRFISNTECPDNIIFLPGSTDDNFKEKFMNTCDAMLHARYEGETFGLAVAEFSMKNKPVITFRAKRSFKTILKDFLVGKTYSDYDEAHIMNLGRKGIYYHDANSLRNILTNFKDYYNPHKKYDVFSKRFSEERVMRQFSRIISGKAKERKNCMPLEYFRKCLFSFLFRVLRKIKTIVKI